MFIAHPFGLSGGTYHYSVAGTFTGGDAKDHTFTMVMDHVPEGSTGIPFHGRFSSTVTDTANDRGNCSTPELTYANSVLYDQGDALSVRSLDAAYCGWVTEAVKDDGMLDPGDTYDSNTNPDGWANNFTIYTFHDDNGIGSHSMAWQAGPNDDKSRVFNVSLEQVEGSTLRSGESSFGFTQPLDDPSFDGTISGMICNWAGPGQSIDPDTHALKAFFQRQFILETENGIFVLDSSVSDADDITYAPTTSCEYDPSRDGLNFSYDLNGDGTISSDEATTVGKGVSNQLAPYVEYDFTAVIGPANF